MGAGLVSDPSPEGLTRAQRTWTIWVCSHCGYAPGNRRNWCNAGCGSDYNRMEPIEVQPVASGGSPPETQPLLNRKPPCLYPLPDGRRCCECESCQALDPELGEQVVERVFARLRELEAGGSSPSLPAEPSDEALNAAYAAYTDLGEDNFDAVRDAIRAAYRIDSEEER